MNQEEIVDYWKIEADESLKVATHLFDKKDYSYALFFGHLAVEKILKAIFVQNVSPNVPRTHNLPRLGGCPRMHFFHNSSLFEKFYPRNIKYMLAVKFYKCLNFFSGRGIVY
jgi:hypothetical protein